MARSGAWGPTSKGAQAVYREMLVKLGNELTILMDIPLDIIAKSAGELIAEGVRRVRCREVEIAAGYDGEYGTINIFSPEEREKIENQMTLF